MSSLVILGLWLAVVGYGVAYTGMQKLNGDPTYSLGKAFRGVAPAATTSSSSSASTQAGTTQAQAQANTANAQGSVIGSQPITSGGSSGRGQLAS